MSLAESVRNYPIAVLGYCLVARQPKEFFWWLTEKFLEIFRNRPK
jgi:hypothetical protein